MSKHLDADIQSMAKTLVKEITITDGKATITKEAYIGSLPEGLTKNDIESVNKYNSTFYPAVTYAFGEKATAAMKKDKKLDQVTLEVPLLDRDHFDITFNRQRTFPNPQAEGEPVKKWGSVSVGLVTQSARANRGDMNTVRDLLSEMAMAALAK